MARGIEGRAIFDGEDDYRRFKSNLLRVVEETHASLVAYCLMPNHVHLDIKVDAIPLGEIMHQILAPHAITFNKIHGRLGHLLQGRYKANLVVDDDYYRRLIPYIENNPVRAGLVRRPEDWPWSSRSGMTLSASELADFDPWATPERQKPRPALESIAAQAAQVAGTSVEKIFDESRSPEAVEIRTRFSGAADQAGYARKEIAEWLRVPPERISFYLRRYQRLGPGP